VKSPLKAFILGAAVLSVVESACAAEVRVPALSLSVPKATVGHWYKKAGEPVAVDEPLLELETDTFTIEVPAPSAGILGEIVAKEGETVAAGALLGQISEGGRAAK
jgi:2-oxoglutarate dehydrogenase E2 component (dihydrolipoamide succinyltransferase)